MSNSAYNPVHNAEATRVAMLAQVEAEQARAIVEKAKIDAQAEQEARSAAVLGKTLTYVGTGTGILILCVGLAFAFTAWLNRKASEIHPGPDGLFPVIVKNTRNGVIVHDPNRQASGTAIYTMPSVMGVIMARAGLHLAESAAHFPQAASEDTQRQITTQAQAVQLMSAATPRSFLTTTLEHKPNENLQLVQKAMGNLGTLRAPTVHIIDDPQRIETATRLLTGEDKP
jgi:hypothetical protein